MGLHGLSQLHFSGRGWHLIYQSTLSACNPVHISFHPKPMMSERGLLVSPQQLLHANPACLSAPSAFVPCTLQATRCTWQLGM